MQRITWRQNDSFYLVGVVTVAGVPQSLAGATLYCQGLMRRGGQADFVHTFTVSPTPSVGGFAVSATALQVATWPVGELECDLLIVTGPSERHTDRFVIDNQRTVTRA